MKKLLLIISLLVSFCGIKAQTYVTTLSTTTAAGEYFNPDSITLSPGFSFTASSGQMLHLYIVKGGCSPLSLALTKANNYILTYVPRIAGLTDTGMLKHYGACDMMVSVQYIDGLGRPLQTVQVQGSPTGKDIIQPFTYDQFGRDSVKYLPYTVTSSSPGAYQTNAVTGTGGYTGSGQYTFYQVSGQGYVNTTYPYAATAYEPSPLNRAIEQGAPGSAWQPGGHTMRMGYGDNAASDIALWKVRVNYNGATDSSYYAAGSLVTDTTTDENGHATISYKDFEGHVVCKKVQSGSGTYLATNYIYDDLGNLCYVIPPLPASVTYPTAFTESDAVFTNFIYGYHYDERQRQIKKKIPGKGWQYMVYNTIDQLVATQDSLQKGNNVWLFTKYDAQGRTVLSGMWNNGNTAISQSSLQASVTGNTTLWETPTTSGNGYTNNAWPTTTKTQLTQNYYDGYGVPNLPAAYSATGSSVMTKGLLTATKTAVLNNPTDTLWAVNYYDDLGRTIQTYKQHYLGATANTNNYDQLTNAYDFTNEVTATTRKHYTTASTTTPALTIANAYTYDQLGRKLQTWEQINSGTNVLLSKLDYNEVGQLLNKHLHSENSGSTYLQSIAYAYNERGWLLTSNTTNSLFNLDLRYNTASSGTQQYNGNIAELHYTGTNSGTKVFNYTYDPLNRLTYANSNSGNLDETIAYDNMGNITDLTRGGASAATLAYTYTVSSNATNQLQSVTKDGSAFRSYSYDVNGNATSDGINKTISYNILNLPQTLTQSATTIATYYYDAAGSKLHTTSTADGNWDYIGGIVYHNGHIAFVNTEEGRADSATYKYQYDLQDHLGDVRVSFDKNMSTGAAQVLQEDEYYSFGLRHNLYNVNGNRYLYNKKEIQIDLANQYDYGARFYDPVIGRWTTEDVDAEDFEHLSPYNYAENNPILMIDPDGNAADSTKTPKPPPVQLKEVKITAQKIHKKTESTVIIITPAMAAANRAQAWDFISEYTPLGREINVITNVLDISSHVKMSKTGTPRVKSGKQLRKEWEKATGKKWPKEPGDPNKNQVAHHIKPLADGGEDGYPNIEPKPADEHRTWHQQLGDFIRWGSTRTNDVN